MKAPRHFFFNLISDEIFVYKNHEVAKDLFLVVQVGDLLGVIFWLLFYCFEQQLNLHQLKNLNYPVNVFYVGQLDKLVYFSLSEAFDLEQNASF